MVANKDIFNDEASAIEAGRKLANAEDSDTVVISGLAGVYPDSENVKDFAQKLFDKVDLISDDDRRWQVGHPEIPQRTGKVMEVTKLDASFFGLHYNQANSMDPMCRIIIEKAYEAVLDSGTNPTTLRGTNTGVYIGACFSESEKTWLYEKLQANGFGVTGCSRSMMANRISYWMGLNGPSFTIDSACSSSMYAFEQGYKAIREGHCDAAIIGGVNLCLHPYVSLQFCRLGVLSMDGRCKAFDDSANGYCRAEAICAIFLQKKKDSKRIYASVVHAKTNCDGYKEQGITYPSGAQQFELLEDFYRECEIDPASLAWVEAHGTGTKVGDPEEVKALVNAFCKGRKTPLRIGSVKSNIGHTEPSSGLCSITKVIIAMETGLIPPNINFKNPRKDIDAFHDGTIKVITDPTPWEGGMVGVNSFGFGGANCHALLKWNEKAKINGGLPKDDLPRLINVSGRTEKAVSTMLEDLEINPVDAELVSLYHGIHKDEIIGHLYRGYTILDKSKGVLSRMIQALKEPGLLYFVFPGLYSEWEPLDETIFKLPRFSSMMSRLSKVLDLDIVKLITKKSQSLDNLINTFISITAIQIGLVEILRSIGIEPNHFIGISIGNITCAYIDGAITAEEAILISYYTAAALLESKLPNSDSACIGLNINEAKALLSDIEIYPIDSKTSYITGLKQSMNKAFSTLKMKNIKIVELKTMGVPINSLCSQKAYPKASEQLYKIIKNNRKITSKWLTNTKTCDAELFCKAILNPRQDDQVLKLIPENANVVEIGPNGVNSLSKKITSINLLNKDKENYASILKSLGSLYVNGIEMDIAKFYPEVQYPVSRSTRMISPLVKWDYSEDWYVMSYKMQDKIKSGERTVSITLSDEGCEYIAGHSIDGRNLFPATGYLALVWETMGLLTGKVYTEMPVLFKDVRFLRATNLSKDGSIDFIITIQKGSGNFEVVEGGAAIVRGNISIPDNLDSETSKTEPEECEDGYKMTSKDFYKELRLRGYNYKGLFRSVVAANAEKGVGKIKWHNNWVAFMDNMLQMQIISSDTRGLFVPTSIDKVIIDAKKHNDYIEKLDENKEVLVAHSKKIKLIKSGGIEIRGLKANAIPRRKCLGSPVLEKCFFIPYEAKAEQFSLDELVRMLVQITLENEPGINIKVVELVSNNCLLAPIIAHALADLPLIQPEITVLTNPSSPLVEGIAPEIIVEDKKISSDQSALIVSACNILDESRMDVLQSCLYALKDGGYIITREAIGTQPNVDYLTLIACYTFENEQIMLLKKSKLKTLDGCSVINVTRDNFAWVEPAKSAMKNSDIKRVFYVSQNDELSGVLGFVNCLRKEPSNEKARCVLILDPKAPKFSFNDPLYANQLVKDAAVNVFKNGQWGMYRHLVTDANRREKIKEAYVNNTVRGDLSSISWIELSPNNLRNKDPEEMVNIRYASLNFRDIMLASGRLAPEVVASNRFEIDCVVGFEWVGRTLSGSKRLMGLANKQGLVTTTEVEKLRWEIPDKWSFEEAATIPVAYATSAYALVIRGKIEKSHSVLIHSGTGAVGQAAINLALFYGCTVFTTVGSKEKREFLLKNFPQLSEKNIGNSRDTSFEQLIMKETNRRGVDIVLNSLSEDKLLASVRCLAKGGKFLEIGKFDLSNNNPLNMELFKRGAGFYGIMLDNLMTKPKLNHVLVDLLKIYTKNGAIKPLNRTIFEKDQVETAFRYMTTGKHMGKVLIKISDDDGKNALPVEVNAKPQFYCINEYSYIIAGGLGGFGMELTDWMVLRGAKKVILNSRRGIANGYQDMRIKLWESYGVDVRISTHDITTKEGVEQLIKFAESLGPVGGIFNLAVVLKDALFENQTAENFEISYSPKAKATIYLDEYSRLHCPKLHQFAVFSSVSCGRGNAGQTNYGMSNSVMERVCEARRAVGLPGVAIQWGAIGDVGLVAEMQDEQIEVVIGGTLQQTINSCLEVLDDFLTTKHPVVASMVVAEKRAGGSSSDNIVDTVVNILGLRDLKNVSLHSTLAELGMDSMMAVEIKQTLEREFEVFLSPQDIRGMTFAKLFDISSSMDGEPQPQGSTEEESIDEDYLITIIGAEPREFKELYKIPSSIPTASYPVFVAPGIEGFATVTEPLVKNLVADVYQLQYDYKTTKETLAEISEPLISQVAEVLSSMGTKTFNIIGYSFGGLVTLEIAYHLEKLGFIGNLYLIDTSPSFMKGLAGLCHPEDERRLQSKLLGRVVNLIFPTNKEKVEEQLMAQPDWDSRVQFVLNCTEKNTDYSVDYQKWIMTSCCCRAKAIWNYDPIPLKSLNSKVTLLKPNLALLPVADDYDLPKYCKNNVEILSFPGNHISILKNKELADYINSMLVKEQLPTKKTNLETNLSQTENVKTM